MNKIISKCLQGQKWAWDAFVEEYAPVIFAAVQRILRSQGLSGQEQTAEDISQAESVILMVRKNGGDQVESNANVEAEQAPFFRGT